MAQEICIIYASWGNTDDLKPSNRNSVLLGPGKDLPPGQATFIHRVLHPLVNAFSILLFLLQIFHLTIFECAILVKRYVHFNT